MRARLLALLAGLLLLTACGLPLPDGVQSAGQVAAEREESASLRVIPPGPQPGATPQDIVRGFLNAQKSPAGDHAVARQFLAPGTAWDDEQGAVVYSARRFVEDDDADPLSLTVRFESTARIEPTGSFSPDAAPVLATYTVARTPAGELRLTSVPPGLHLTTQDRERSFTANDIYFLARGMDGAGTGRLVPDRVFLPVTSERAPALVSALLAGPTSALRPAVESAVPAGTDLASPVSVVEGVVTVDLTAQVQDLDSRGRQRLSAQLVWTLPPTVAGVRLLSEGRPFEVAGAGELQTREDWAEYDPAGVTPGAPLYYVQDRQLRALDGAVPQTEASTPGGFAVDEAAVSPVGATVGLLTRTAGPDELRIGPLQGPYGPPVLRREGLGSLTWGSGDQGLWALAAGPQPRVCLLPPAGTPPGTDPCDVAYERPPGAGPLTALRVSRDGARVALVFGTGPGRRLHVGRVEPAGGRPRIAGVEPVAPSLTNVTDVAWASGTSLAVLASAGASQVVVWTVVVDGSAPPAAVQRPGLPGSAVSVAAAPGRPLTVSALLDERLRLFRDNGTLFRVQDEPGGAPAYPG